jgi:trehalose synthase-fused probable maltokinase
MSHDTQAFEETLRGALPGFLPSRRWFGGKNRTLHEVSLVDHVWVRNEAAPDVLAFVEVSYADASPEQYCLWLGVRDTPDVAPVVGRMANGRWMVDVSTDQESARALLQRLAAGADLATAGGGAVRFGDLTREAAAFLRGAPPVRTLGADQSNTSLGIGEALVLKLFRRVQPGENPEVEIGRFLTTRTAFRDFSPLHGSATYVAAHGPACTVGVLQAWVDNSGDGWRYVQHRLASELDQAGSWASVRDDLFRLGAITAGFHLASASDPESPRFAPAPIESADVRNWVTAVMRQAASALQHVRNGPLEANERAPLERALALAGPGTWRHLPPIDSPGGSFCGIRIHGDFHLGQTLKTASGFVLIDFEGEPTRTVEERCRKQCALKDVAGMLRSFEYALVTACTGAPDRMDPLRTRLNMSGTFLEGYFSAPAMATAVFLPAHTDARERWIRFFEIEKAVYELDYELNNRPDWAHIPARGLLRLLDA